MRLLLILALCVASAAGTVAQNQSTSDPLTRQPPDNCEGNSARLDVVRNKSIAAGGKKNTIPITRLGNGEQTKENQPPPPFQHRAHTTPTGLPSPTCVLD